MQNQNQHQNQIGHGKTDHEHHGCRGTMSSEGAGSSSNNKAKSKPFVDLCHFSDSDSDSDSDDDHDQGNTESHDSSDPLKHEQDEPGPSLQRTGASSSCTQAQGAESESESAEEKHNHEEILNNCFDNEADSSGPADEADGSGPADEADGSGPADETDNGTVGNDAARRETAVPSNTAKITKGPQAQRRISKSPNSPDLVKKTRTLLMKIVDYFLDESDSPLDVKVDFYQIDNGTKLKLNNDEVSARDVGLTPGLLWRSLNTLALNMNVDDDKRTEALNEVLAMDNQGFKIEKFEACEGREDNLIGSFKIHLNEGKASGKPRVAGTKHAQSESDKNEGKASDDEDSNEDQDSLRRSSRRQTKTSFYHNTEHCRGSKRKQETDEDADDATDRTSRRRSSRKASDDKDSNEDRTSRRRSSRPQLQTSFRHNTEHCHGSQREQETDAEADTLSKKAQTQFVSSSSCNVKNSATTSRSDDDSISNQSNSDDEVISHSGGSNTSSTNQSDTASINTSTSGTPSIETAQNNIANEAVAWRRFNMLYSAISQYKKPRHLKEMLLELKSEDDVRKTLELWFRNNSSDTMIQLVHELLIEEGEEDNSRIIQLFYEMAPRVLKHSFENLMKKEFADALRLPRLA